MEITGPGYRVERDEGTARVVFEGTLRLSGTTAYRPIYELLDETGRLSDTITLDMRKLKLLNSDGINMLYKFAFNLGRMGGKKLIVFGSSTVPWQKKDLS